VEHQVRWGQGPRRRGQLLKTEVAIASAGTLGRMRNPFTTGRMMIERSHAMAAGSCLIQVERRNAQK
jgi:hypothetical protein